MVSVTLPDLLALTAPVVSDVPAAVPAPGVTDPLPTVVPPSAAKVPLAPGPEVVEGEEVIGSKAFSQDFELVSKMKRSGLTEPEEP